jgi:hypothetical protein
MVRRGTCVMRDVPPLHRLAQQIFEHFGSRV